MKRIYTILVAVLLSNIVFSQMPCTWFTSGPTPDQSVIDAGLRNISIKRIPTGTAAPEIGYSAAEIDNVWYSVDTVNIGRRASGYTPDPDFKAHARFMYDENWMYILVVVTGDLEIDQVGTPYNQDCIQLYFQNTWGGKGTAAEHCNDVEYANWYWEQDGDKYWTMPSNRNENLVWLDQDVDDACGGNDCGEVSGDDWLTYSALNILKYNTYAGSDTIIYECAFHLKNWMKYSYTNVIELEGYEFGFDIAVRDEDGIAGITDILKINDPGNNVWAWAKACGHFTFGDDFEIEKHTVTFTIDDGSAPISGAQIIFNSETKTTNVLGQAVFTDVLSSSFINYQVSATGYYSKNESFSSVTEDKFQTVSLVVIPPTTYDVTFTVDDGTDPISGAKVVFNSQSLFTNGSGQAAFLDVPIGNDKIYNVSNAGYATSSGTINVVDQDVNANVNLDTILAGTYVVTFIINDGTNPISDAVVMFNGLTLISDISGQAIFHNISTGDDYLYSVLADGYQTSSGSLDIAEDISETISLALIPPTYYVTFNVDDGTSPVAGAQVTFNAQVQTTDGAGQTIFTNISVGNDQIYDVQATSFVGKAGTVNVVDQNVNETVHLLALIPGTYTVTFIVQDGSNPLNDVYVEFNSEIKKTGSDGKAIFNNVYSEMDMPYKADLSGYQTATGTVDVNGADLNSTILMFSTGINDSELRNIKIYPNPVKDILTIKNALDISSISIVTITGQVRLTVQNDNLSIIEFDLSDFESGVYFINIITSVNKVLRYKIIKY